MRHPIMTQGREAMCNAEEYQSEAIVRIDMPGIGKDGLDIQIKGDSIHIVGKAEKEAEDEEDMAVRIYKGAIDLLPSLYDTHEIKASIKLGVLRTVIPKMKGSTPNNAATIKFHGAPDVVLPWERDV
ncbi:small heat shock protein, chloroplastic-like [Cornus florida]|uniref:small heat shock protein, chloroplastic-like n=1 Tax=Cornus florida TaxID=4283 RepID=UPI00289D2E15|nr:small heat shock protein, chloroplastic-like [Cornus florida]